MDTGFWVKVWEDDQVHFHQKSVNPYLERYWDRLRLNGDETVLVPLCGKSKDMVWLNERGHNVYGVEISPIAVQAFFEENKIEHDQYEKSPFVYRDSGEIKILNGDFFHLTKDHLNSVSAVFDRAAIVALSEPLRYRYANHLINLLTTGTRVLLITVEYPEIETLGPPFSVRQSEIEKLFISHFKIELLGTDQYLARSAKFQKLGIRRIEEKVYHLQRT